MDIKIEEFSHGMKQVKVYGRRVAYCSERPPVVVSFLPNSVSLLSTDDEKSEVMRFVRENIGPLKRGKPTEDFFPDDSTDD